MYCTTCGANIPNGSRVCHNCGALTHIEAEGTEEVNFNTVEPPAREQIYQPVYEEKRSKKGLIIGFSIAGIILATGITILVLFLTGVFGSSSSNKFVGTWRFESMEMMGMTLTAETLSQFGSGFSGGSVDIDFSQMYVKVSEDGKTEMSFMGEGISTQGQFVEDKLRLEVDGVVVNCFIEDGKLVMPMEEAGEMGNIKFVK